MVFEAEYFERLHRDVYFSTQLSFTATVICITWNPPVVGKGVGESCGMSRRALQTLTLFKTKTCLFCYPVKDKRLTFTTLIHFVLVLFKLPS